MGDILVPPVVFADGTAAAPSIRFRFGGQTGFFRTGTAIGMTVKGTEVARWSAGGAQAITSAAASAFAVGRLGATTPALSVDASAATSVTGIKVSSAAAASGVAVVVTSSGTNESMTIDAKGSGTILLNATATGAVLVGDATNPAFSVVHTTEGTGVSVTSAAAAGGVAVAAISSGTNENLTVDAKGSGTITLNGTGTGNIVLGRAATGVSLSVTGGATTRSATAVPATAGAVAAGAALIANSNGMTIEWTTDAPTHTRPKGSLCLNINGSSTSTRLYVNSDGAGSWVAVTTAS